MGNVMLEVNLKEKSTGYEEKTSELLTVAEVPANLKLIPEGIVYKPGLPFSILVISQTPDNKPLETEVELTLTYLNDELEEKNQEKKLKTVKGKALLEITPPKDSVALIIEGSADGAQTSKVVEASYSPSGNFIHLEQITEGLPEIGDELEFKVYSTKEAANFYYEVISRGMVVFTDFTKNNEISFKATPLMAPSAKLLVYQILPSSAAAADYLPFKIKAVYPHSANVEFGQDEAKPGEKIDVDIKTEGEAHGADTANITHNRAKLGRPEFGTVEAGRYHLLQPAGIIRGIGVYDSWHQTQANPIGYGNNSGCTF